MPAFSVNPLCRMALSHNRLRSMHWFTAVFYRRARAHHCDAPVAFAAHIRYVLANRDAVPAEFSASIPPRGASEGGGLHGRENAAWDARDARRRRAAARAHRRRRPAAPLRSVGTGIRSGRLRARHCADHFGGACLRRDRPPLCSLSHLRARSALRFQSHQPGAVFRRPCEAGGARGVVAGPACFLLSMAHGENGGRVVWLYAWAIWVAFSLAVQFLYPTVFVRWFNKFTPLEDAGLRRPHRGLARQVWIPLPGACS